jgi:hypothetical protein
MSQSRKVKLNQAIIAWVVGIFAWQCAKFGAFDALLSLLGI